MNGKCFVRIVDFISDISIAFVIIVGCLVLGSWIFGSPLPAGALSAPHQLTADTGLSFLLIGIALKRMRQLSASSARSVEPLLYALVALIVGCVSLLVNLAHVCAMPGWILFLLSGPLQKPDNFMPVHAAATMVLVSCSTLMLMSASLWSRRSAFCLSQLVLILSICSLLIHVYQVPSVGLSRWLEMPVTEALCFAALSVAIFSLYPEGGLRSLLLEYTPSGRIFRWFFAAAAILPVCLGGLILGGQTAGFYDIRFAVTSLILAFGFFLVLTAWALLRRTGQIELHSARFQESLVDLQDEQRLTFENVAEALVVLDSQGLIIEWNRTAAATFGWSREEVAGHNLQDNIFPEEQYDLVEESLKNARNPYEDSILNKAIEADLCHKDGRRIPVELCISSVLIKGDYKFCMFARDISVRRRMSLELSAARDQAMEASRLKSQFVANMSHEIRTPLNAIIGLSDLLTRKQLSDEVRDYAMTIRDSADALLNIVNDILDYSRIEAGKLFLEVVDVNVVSVVEGAAQLIAARAREKGLSLSNFVSPDIPSGLQGDPSRIRQVLLNLLANSIKFTDIGEVVLRADLDSVSGNNVTVRFSVTDTGVGISETGLSRIFEPFTQADGSVTRKYGGTGLGLSISKRLVDLMGGEIAAQSTPGQGSTFWFTVPLERRTGKRRQVTPSRKVFHDVRLLIIDGPEHSRGILQAYVSSWGIACDTVETGEAALHTMRREAAAGSPYDLAILDFQLTHSDALALARSIRHYEDLASTKLILVSSFDDRQLAQSALQSGFSAYLTKPLKQSRLYDCIVNLLTGEGRQELKVDSGEFDAGQPVGADKEVQPEAPESGQPEPPHGGLVLVVEDNPVNQKVAVLQLTELGYAAHSAANGIEALDALERTRYSLVLMDCQMPEMDGFEATRLIRQRESLTGCHVPIIAMTAHAMAEDRYRCLSAGMDDYISKPVDRKRLERVLKQHAAATTVQVLSVEEPDRGAGGSSGGTESSSRPPAEVDVDALCRIFGRDEAAEILNTFVASTENLLSKMESAVAAGDEKTLQLAAHELKGSAGSVFAAPLAGLAQELEESCRSRDWGKIQNVEKTLSSTFHHIKGSLSGCSGSLR